MDAMAVLCDSGLCPDCCELQLTLFRVCVNVLRDDIPDVTSPASDKKPSTSPQANKTSAPTSPGNADSLQKELEDLEKWNPDD